MRALNVIVLTAVLALAGTGAAHAVEVQTEQAARDDCSGSAQAEITQCLTAKRDASVQALDAARAHANAALAKWYEDAKYARQATQRLAAADQAFQRYRAAQCAFNRSLGGGAIGNALDMRSLACEVEMNLVRAEQLEQLAGRIRAR